ncbi:hypothetical protein KPH14_012860 [Odynerus spinipes]|uniref:CCHC-type domain-containing protein n=1 Tax=Odynerus spinipes TaxID=1348599 RepID=A0AAD9VK76_9HYME|nr:hypothetical protein KPH14_012860 [Odynerus spinipes]
MDPENLTTRALKEILRRHNLVTSGCKVDLILRLDAAFPNRSWINMLQQESAIRVESVEEGAVGGSSIIAPVRGNQTTFTPSQDAREVELLRREMQLLQRELELERRESEALRNRPQSARSTHSASDHVNIRALGELLSDFNGQEDSFEIWERQVTLKISLRSDLRKPAGPTVRPQNKEGTVKEVTGRTTTWGRRCFNCNQEGHMLTSCPHPRRVRGSCYTCGEMGHLNRDCPKGQSRSVTRNGTTTALVESSQSPREQVSAQGTGEVISYEAPAAASPIHEYCVLMANADKEGYCVQTLVDSGSRINIMLESVYLRYFSDYELGKEHCSIGYGGVNKSPLQVYGHVTLRIRLQLLPNNVFQTKFAVVADTTMSYSALLGQEFLIQSGVKVTLGRSMSMECNETTSDILCIEVDKTNGVLDTPNLVVVLSIMSLKLN